MPYFETTDRTSLFYKAWGAGKPVVFISSWSVGVDMWQYQMAPLSEQGLCCIGYDRRGHGRSDDPGRGYDFDTLADDLAALLEHLDLHEVTLVGHSMGCNEVLRYLARHGASHVARVALTSTTTPCVLRKENNPNGAPKVVLDQTIAALHQDRASYVADGAIKFFGLGSTWPWPSVASSEMVQWMTRLTLDSSLKALIECQRALWETDFRADLQACTVPTLIIHGDKDQSAPLDLCARRTAAGIAGSELKIYEGAAHGLFITEKERLNRDLLAFVQA